MFFFIYSSTPSILVITVEKKFAICFEFNIFLLLAPCWSELRHLAVQHMESRCPGYGVPLSRIWSPAVQDVESSCPGYGVPAVQDMESCCPGYGVPAVQDMESRCPGYGVPAVQDMESRFLGYGVPAVQDFGSLLSKILTLCC